MMSRAEKRAEGPPGDLDVETYLTRARRVLGDGTRPGGEDLYAGVDLGTSTIQVNLVDSDGLPVGGRMVREDAVRDGVVLDYRRAVDVLVDLSDQLLDGADELPTAVGYPPGTDARAQRNAARDAGFDVVRGVSEPEAARELLGVEDGTIVDIGGGTTGITVVREGTGVHSTDVATGGHHISLVLAGSRGIEYEEAERIRETQQLDSYESEVLPVIEKMASIVEENLTGAEAGTPVYLVGGTCVPEGFEVPFERLLDRPVFKPSDPLLVTPLGIARAARDSDGRTN